MSQEKEINKRFGNLRKKLVLNLLVNWLIPVVLVMVLRRFFASDATALAIAGIIPAVRTVALWMRHHRVEWIGIFSVIGFAAAFTVSVVLGGSSLPLKLYHPIVTGSIGLIFLISTIIRKPLLIIIRRALKYGSPEQINNPANYKKFTILTVVLGFIFLVDAVIHIIMALTLSTVTFLAMSKVVTIGILAILVIGRWIVRNNK